MSGPIKCACGRCFGPTAANYRGSQLLGGLYMILLNCVCGSTKAIVLHDDEPEAQS